VLTDPAPASASWGPRVRIPYDMTGDEIDLLAPCDLTILMPCLNEAETLGVCIQKARSFLERAEIHGEIVVADNGSSDGSIEIAEVYGARVVHVPQRGYGNALIAGIEAAGGQFVIMGDADDSYDFSNLDSFMVALRSGADLVMGNRFEGGIAPGAMPPLHRYLGNPVLSRIGRIFYKSKIGDFHCGLRGFRRTSILALDLQAGGMEFASEMVVKATQQGLRIGEVPTTLRPDGRTRAPHLRTWRDGWRHLRFLLLYSPRWLFFYPGLVLMLLAIAVGVVVEVTTLRIGDVALGVDTLVVCYALLIIGFQSVLFAVFTKTYGTNEGFLPRNEAFQRALRGVSLERGVVGGLVLFLLGLAGLVVAFLKWNAVGFGSLDATQELRLVIPSAALLTLGSQATLASAFLGVLEIRRREPAPVRHLAESDAVEPPGRR
jgi:glycosyltransferase involved in cell wall biosynthesis